ncbi:hypothetical protein R3X27_24940 [Tropicimonas sp. TH_r6]|uniref:hypothetical protein n=1 Tax=Tropicimonas sp. TH_r6 TaxID=3082085 RepID=UPI002953B408|nr:hypothetical protein [Tropicimonas sp. TH_r6]MDV7145936.1 hypothetical protein [Tropicimonas sp. TH_r6]
MLQYLQEQRQGLLAAANMLGGGDGRELVEGLFDEIPRNGLSARRVRLALRALIALLSLANVHDHDSVEEIRLLADGLRERLQALFDREPTLEKGRPAA